MNFRPCIDLHKGVVKQIIGSTLSEDGTSAMNNFVSSKGADYYAEMFKEDNLYGGHICMLGAGNESAAKQALSQFNDGFQIGGGINENNAQEYLNSGASHVIISSYLFNGENLSKGNLAKILEVIPTKNLVFDLSCKRDEFSKKYFVCIKNWTFKTNFEINKENFDYLSDFCDEFLIHSTAVEGKKSGPDIELISLLASFKVKNKITYAGGISSFKDIETVRKAGKDKIDITIGSALDIFGGNLKYKDVVDFVKKIN